MWLRADIWRNKMIQGSMVALITPFNEDGSVNLKRQAELIDWHIENGTDGILILGTTAETPSLTAAEQEDIVRVSIDAANGRKPIIVGSGSNNSLVAKEKSLKFQGMGADGLLVITPYYNKTNKAGMIHHFMTVADEVKVPLYIYNVPGRTGCALTYDTVAELAKHPMIVGVKEASGDMSFVTKISRLIDDNFNIYSGNDDITIPIMSMGGAGAISVLANILPRETHEMTMAYINGDVKKAAAMQKKYLAFINALFIETNPIPVKEAMNLAGLNVGGFRLPLYPMADETRAVLADNMRALDIIK